MASKPCLSVQGLKRRHRGAFERRNLRRGGLTLSSARIRAALALVMPQMAKVEFVCLDDRLCSAARKEGLAVQNASQVCD